MGKYYLFKGYSAVAQIAFMVIALAFCQQGMSNELGADTNPFNEAATAEKILQQSERIETIDITKRVADGDIATRINKILDTSEWFESLGVSVAEGIVILTGQTAKREHRIWAETIASRTEGVVAVINQITLAPDAQRNLAPVLTEGRNVFNWGIDALPVILSSLVVLILTLLLFKYATSFSFRVLTSRIESAMLRRMVARISAIPLLIIGIYILLRITGLGALAATVVGGTGLLGLIIGFAFRDITENFLASILISIERPFRLGDSIKVLEFTGVVQAVTTRGTVIMTMDGNHVQIPNTKIYKEAIVNFSANPNRRLDFTVGIGYESSIAHAQATALKILQDHPAVLNQPEPWVLAEQLAAATVNLRIYFWVNTRDHNAAKVKSAIIRLVKSTFMKSGISMPDDAREIIFPQGIHVSTNAKERQPNEIGVINNTPIVTSTPHIAEDSQSCTSGEGKLDTDVPAINEQADNSVLGDSTSNLLKK